MSPSASKLKNWVVVMNEVIKDGNMQDAAHLNEAVDEVPVGIGGGDVLDGVIVNQDDANGVFQHRDPKYLHFRVQLFPSSIGFYVILFQWCYFGIDGLRKSCTRGHGHGLDSGGGDAAENHQLNLRIPAKMTADSGENDRWFNTSATGVR
uniref:Uncharacterized protein n=1 Tax=Candidatus Kentrum sp. MB TaxID=2138164 RepID=A0A450XTB9_9GAMM|nr:MAG: hypothetical protein BECKMB1821I_GA0114274_103415 [Candidatus Kentron sp. MB]VFK75962.1 MAG: hypothetical protein BECKMB1821H_GA0114242_103715 [Candidatus Kentron sp. MB]